MHASYAYPLMALLLVMSLFFCLFVLPIGYTYGETCTRCQGKGTVTCETCYGSGTCWICGGDGVIDYMPPESQWCAACQGTGRCYTCEGSGWHVCEECGGGGTLFHWMFTTLGSMVVLSTVNMLLFVGMFLLSGVFSAFYLSYNEWLYKVDDMGFWFNPSFMTWLFARHRQRWAKWQTATNSILAVYFGAFLFAIFSLRQITGESLLVGFLFSIIVVGLFSFLFYKSYTSRLIDGNEVSI